MTILKMNIELFAYDVTQEKVVACTNHFAIAFVCENLAQAMTLC